MSSAHVRFMNKVSGPHMEDKQEFFIQYLKLIEF